MSFRCSVPGLRSIAMEEENTGLIIDNDSSMRKANFAGDDVYIAPNTRASWWT